MATRQTKGAFNRHRAAAVDGPGRTDGELMTQFVAWRDGAAFAALVDRHGPMVWGVCRRLLVNHHDAEDAFQAAFLVLARKAATVRPREMVAAWLYGVAYRAALKARALAVRRRTRERQVPEMPEPEVVEEALWLDLQPLLDRELNQLPEKYRAAVVLCDLQGKSYKDASRQLGCPEGTLAARLARARAQLAKRLARHGVVATGAALAAVVVRNAARAGAPAAVTSSTVKAATLLAAGKAATGLISANAAALTEGVLKGMLLTKLKVLAVVLLAVGILVAGSGTVAYGAWRVAANAWASATPSNSAEPQSAVAPPDTPVTLIAADDAKSPSKDDPKKEPPLPKVTTKGGGVAPESFDQALEWMRGDHQALQLIALGSLAQMETPFEPRREEVTAQMEKMLNGRDSLVALEASKALVPWATKKQIPSLTKALDDDNVFLRQNVVDCLGALNDAPGLIKALEDKNLQLVRKSALKHLSEMKEERAVEPIARMLKSELFFERDPAIKALIAIGPAAEKEVRKYLQEEQKETREAAQEILAKIGTPDKDDAFNTAFGALRDKSPAGRKKAVEYFTKADPENHPRRVEVAKTLAELVQSDDVFARNDSVKPLCRWATKDEVPALLEVAGDKQRRVTCTKQLAEALGRLKDERAIPVLGEMLGNGFDNSSVSSALAAFGEKGAKEAVQHLDPEKPQVVVAACEVLKECGTKEHAKVLEDFLEKTKRDHYGQWSSIKDGCNAAIKKIKERNK
jgi:RNA polymerase sigma factor (sigma-70 family)